VSESSDKAASLGQYAEIIRLIDSLVPNSDRLLTDSYVSGRVSRLRSLFLMLDRREKDEIAGYLKTNVCANLTGTVPNTVGQLLCGCLLQNYNGIDARCTVGCSDSPFAEVVGRPCDETVLHWKQSSGGATSTVVQKGNCTCRAYVEEGFSATQTQREKFANDAGCENVFLYDASTNSPISVNGRPTNDRASAFVMPKRSSKKVAQQTPTGAATQTAQGLVSAQAAQNLESSNGSSAWIVWLFILFIIFIIVGIAIYINWVD
jgi:hypothetical protein